MSDSNRGGRREGAGRPKSEPTKMQRVPVGCFGATSAVCMRYRQYDLQLLEQLKETAQRVDELYFESKYLHLIMAIALLSEPKVAVNVRALRRICQTMLNPEGI